MGEKSLGITLSYLVSRFPAQFALAESDLEGVGELKKGLGWGVSP